SWLLYLSLELVHLIIRVNIFNHNKVITLRSYHLRCGILDF
ncbi:hypothetical protein LINPERHAP1_LOCUS37690, partial [Linum perenne]